MKAYHITERSNWPSIQRHGLRTGTAPAYEDVGLKAIFFTLQKPTREDILAWEDLYDPIIATIDIPPDYDVWPDEAGNEIYPEVEPVYVTKSVPPNHIKGFIEVKKDFSDEQRISLLLNV